LSPLLVPRSAISAYQIRPADLTGDLELLAASSQTNWHATCIPLGIPSRLGRLNGRFA